MRFIDAEEVGQHLTYDRCIPLMREAMIAFSIGRTRQLLRAIIPLDGDNLFGVMPGALGVGQPFGAKLISVFPGNFAIGGPSHQGVILLFSFIYVLVNLAVDLLYTVFDPRIRY